MKLSQIFTYPFYKQCWKMLFLLLATILLTRYSKGLFGGVIVLIGLWGAFTRRPAYALMAFAVLPFMVVMNPMVFPFGRFLGLSARLGAPAIAFAMLIAASQRKGRQAIPLLGLIPFLLVAMISSMGGYCPMVSYFKIANFALFVFGIYVGTKNLDRKEGELQKLRAFLFAFSVFIIAGSLLLHFVRPFAAHYSAYAWHLGAEGAESAVDAMYANQARTGDFGFLCGVVNHSQCLGPTAALIAGWLLCDMLFIEKKFMSGHVILLLMCPVVLYMTKSRTSLLSFVTVVFIVTFYCVPKFRVSPALKRRIRGMMGGAFVLMLVGAGVLEATRGVVSKWVLKYGTDDPKQEISLNQVTSTRQGLMNEALYDFRQNPLFGKGFQVSYEHQFLKTEGRLILSAPIEKGFIPTMILGETGIVGSIAFLAFLIGFFAICLKKQYWVTLALFSTLFVANLGEATFFSPGGAGGPEWIIAAAGGFVVDMVALVQQRKSAMGGMPSYGRWFQGRQIMAGNPYRPGRPY